MPAWTNVDKSTNFDKYLVAIALQSLCNRFAIATLRKARSYDQRLLSKSKNKVAIALLLQSKSEADECPQTCISLDVSLSTFVDKLLCVGNA